MKSLLLVSLFSLGVALSAQAQVLFGPRVGYDVDVQELFVGGDLRTSLGTLPVDGQLAADFFLIDELTLIQIGANVLYDISGGPGEAFTPYAGAGLAIRYADAEGIDASTDLGLNLLAGARFNTRSAITPFIQARMTVEDGTSVAAMGGILFAFGRR